MEEKRNKRKEEIRREEQLFSAQFVLHTRIEWTFLILQWITRQLGSSNNITVPPTMWQSRREVSNSGETEPLRKAAAAVGTKHEHYQDHYSTKTTTAVLLVCKGPLSCNGP